MAPKVGFAFFLGVFTLGISTFAFYVALEAYVQYGGSAGYVVQRNLLLAQRYQDQLMQDKALLDSLNATCFVARNRTDELQFTPDFIDFYGRIDGEIETFNETCHQTLDDLSNTLMQIINMTNATSQSVQTGSCQLNSRVVNDTSTSTVDYDYRVVALNGLDFYFYVFNASTTPVPMDEEGVFVENCSPIIFDSSETALKPFWVSPFTSVREVRLGQQRLELVAESGLAVNETFSIPSGFQVWFGLF